MPPLPEEVGPPHPEPIPLPDLRRPERTPSLPAWLALRIASVSDLHQPDQKTEKHRMMATLPRNLALSEVERDEIVRHLRALDALFGPTPFDDPKVEGLMLIDLTHMVLSMPSAAQNEASSEARGEAYLAALEDLPLWAVKAAIRRWHRGDAGKKSARRALRLSLAPSTGRAAHDRQPRTLADQGASRPAAQALERGAAH